MITLTLDDVALKRNAFSELSLSVAKSKKIVVVTGAGISCSCGIPDFRSSDGLYALVKEQYPDAVLKGRDLFDSALFRDTISTSVFYTFISQLKQSVDAASPSATHKFIKTLDSKKKLLRSYTQNIDGFEGQVGLASSSSQEVKSIGKGKSKIRSKDVKNVQLHGDIHRVRCMSCSAEYPCTKEYLKLFSQGLPPACPECSERSKARVARSARPIRVGSLRPAIVLYDEPHPLGDDIGTMQTADLARKPDTLIIMGTSLKVHGLKKLVKEFARVVHDAAPLPSASPRIKDNKRWAGKVIFVNRTPPGPEWAGIIDYHVSGETDKWVDIVLQDWKARVPTDWETQQTLDLSMKIVKILIPAASKGKAMKKRVGEENMPPADVFGPFEIPKNKPPSSPGKRQHEHEDWHYGNPESPSKRRIAPVDRTEIEDGDRRLLFDATNQDDTDNEMSIEMTSPPVQRKPVPVRSIRRTRSQGLLQPRKTRSQTLEKKASRVLAGYIKKK